MYFLYVFLNTVKSFLALRMGRCYNVEKHIKEEAFALRRFFCFLLVILLLGALTGCKAAPAAQDTAVDLPIITQSRQSEARLETTQAAPDTEAPVTEVPDTEAPATESPATAPATEPPATAPATEPAVPETEAALSVTEDGVYDSKEEVALYIHLFGHLPSNYITKKEAEKLGWPGGSLEPYAPGKCIGGSRFGNYEGLLPDAKGRVWTECDIDTRGAKSRGAKRIVFSNDGLIYYTGDHYEHFELLYGEED